MPLYRVLAERLRTTRPTRSLRVALDDVGARGDLRRVLEAFLAGVVGTLVVAMYLPIFKLASAV